MLSSLHRFGVVLRRAGLDVSAADIATAAEATRAIDFGDRESLRRALRLTLSRRREQAVVFDAAFDAVFAASRDGGDDFAAALAALLGAARARALSADLAAISPAAAALVGASPSDLDSLADASGASLEVASAASPLLAGAIAYRLAAELGTDDARAEIERRLAALLPDADVGGVAELVRARANEVREALRAYVSRAIALAQPQMAPQAISLSLLEARSFASLTIAELRELTAEVDRIARALLAARRRRRRSKSRGRLDVARTLRRSLATDGVPMVPAFIRRRRRRPRIVVLCDVSDSVRNVSRFMLQLVYSIARLTDGVRAFAFVADLGEITSAFRSSSIDKAVSHVISGQVINVLANSNYGRSFAQFATRHLSAVTSRTTVIIIGDGRTNYHDPGLAHLAAIRRRAGRLLWLNPEPAAIWGFGDSAMDDYRPLCDDIAVVTNLVSLRALARDLL